MTRYPLILRVIHWFTALMFIPMLAGGYFVIRTMASTDPVKLDALMYHMAIGVFLVALTALAWCSASGRHIPRRRASRFGSIARCMPAYS